MLPVHFCNQLIYHFIIIIIYFKFSSLNTQLPHQNRTCFSYAKKIISKLLLFAQIKLNGNGKLMGVVAFHVSDPSKNEVVAQIYPKILFPLKPQKTKHRIEHRSGKFHQRPSQRQPSELSTMTIRWQLVNRDEMRQIEP